jgi:hypothetical protein
MRPIPPKIIDGVKEESSVKDGSYDPKGVLSHEFFPPTSVLICDIGSDLSYLASYWLVDKIWRLFIHDVDVYERLRDKLLQQRVVVVDYTDMNNLGIYIPKPKHVDGMEEMFRATVDVLRDMDKENLDRHLSEVSHMSQEDFLTHRFG